VANRIKAGGSGGLEPLADSVLSGTMTPHDAALRLLKD
jgi:LAO/AO transport system kinase